MTDKSVSKQERGTMTEDGSPGSHPHADRPNWQPGDDDAEELQHQKLVDALRSGLATDRELAKLAGVSRKQIWHSKLWAAIPDGLFERLVAARVGKRAAAVIGRIYAGRSIAKREEECCPNGGHVLRVRNKSVLRALDIMDAWIADGRPPAHLDYAATDHNPPSQRLPNGGAAKEKPT